MTEKEQIYRCNICGNMMEVLHLGTGKMLCCNNQMELLKERSEDMGFEKHRPVIEKTPNGVKVKIGSLPHPMEDNHCIEWVEVIADNQIYRHVFYPGEQPEAEFKIKAEDISSVKAREYCSVHGLWVSE